MTGQDPTVPVPVEVNPEGLLSFLCTDPQSTAVTGGDKPGIKNHQLDRIGKKK